MKNMFLLVGLGNPEGKYFQTYHNIGFLCADKVAAELGTEFKKKGNQLIAKTDNFFLLKPRTFMNLSGQAVQAVSRKYQIAPERIIVFVDDLYIDKGSIRVSKGSGSGGHNGLKSVDESLGTNHYIKVRVGIKPVGNKSNLGEDKKSQADYVLSKMDTGDRFFIDPAIEKAVEAALMIVKGESLSVVQGKFNMTNQG